MDAKRWMQLGVTGAVALAMYAGVPAAPPEKEGQPSAASEAADRQNAPDSTAENGAQARTMSRNTVPAVPLGLNDPVMEQYVDVALLSKAWTSLNAALMSDTALQMKHAEDVLLRTHPTLTSETLMEMAARVAVETSDEVALARIRRAGEAQGNEKVVAYIDGMSRDPAAQPVAEPSISVSELTPESLVEYRQILTAIRFAKVSRDEEGLEQYLSELESLTDMNQKLGGYLQELATRSRNYVTTTPDNPGATVVNSLNLLAAYSDGKAQSSNNVGHQPGTPPKTGSDRGPHYMAPGTGSDQPGYRTVPGTGSDAPPYYPPVNPDQPSQPGYQPPYQPGYQPPYQPGYPPSYPPGTPDYPPQPSYPGYQAQRWLLGIQVGSYDWRWGASVRYVYPGSAAERIGLEQGDWIVSVDGQQLRNQYEYSRLLTYSSGYIRLAIWDKRTQRTIFRWVRLDRDYSQSGPPAQTWNVPPQTGYGSAYRGGTGSTSP